MSQANWARKKAALVVARLAVEAPRGIDLAIEDGDQLDRTSPGSVRRSRPSRSA
ncbi:hypothetical protein ACIBW9_04305 [Streptomyces sp. NPDC049541]|uniref:hypothetical protein n=1 Tax=Streptomyces sp. NPDC049541 TaxID=3365594 RepID=UPI0037BA8248